MAAGSKARTASVLLALLAPAVVRANDGVMGGSGADLVPMKTADVSMLSEDIQITYKAGVWQVDARYEFRNTKDAALTLQLGFPEYRCEDTEGDCVSPDAFRFEDMRTELRGEPVEQHKGKVSDKHAWGPRLGGVWLFDVHFGAGESVPVHHSYQVPSGYIVDGTQYTTYVTRTGALWAGPIGHALFRVRVPITTSELSEPEEIARAGVGFVKIDGKRLAELRYEARDWSPQGDLSFGFRDGITVWDFDEEQKDMAADGPARSGLGDDERCQNFGAIWSLAADAIAPNPRPGLAREIAAAFERGTNTRRICTNTVFALHGRRFQDDRLNHYFYGAKGFVAGEWPYAPMEPNPQFEPSWLSKVDWKTIELCERLPEAKSAAGANAEGERGQTPAASGASDPHAKPAAKSAQAHGCGCELSAASRARGQALLLTIAWLLALRRASRRVAVD